MASDASKPREMAIELPQGTQGQNQASVSISVIASVTMTVPDGDTIAVETIGTLPPRTSHMYVQARQCGDWYCEVKADRYVAAIGETRRAAAENAIRKAGGSAA